MEPPPLPSFPRRNRCGGAAEGSTVATVPPPSNDGHQRDGEVAAPARLMEPPPLPSFPRRNRRPYGTGNHDEKDWSRQEKVLQVAARAQKAAIAAAAQANRQQLLARQQKRRALLRILLPRVVVASVLLAPPIIGVISGGSLSDDYHTDILVQASIVAAVLACGCCCCMTVNLARWFAKVMDEESEDCAKGSALLGLGTCVLTAYAVGSAWIVGAASREVCTISAMLTGVGVLA
eukprot:COSAG02_NODE_23605_length_713_cov_1.381773_1_plen_233_part_10